MGKQKMLIDVCHTRWAAHHDACSHFFIVKALEVIAHDLHTDDYTETVTTGWEGKYKAVRSELLTRIEEFEFIIMFLTVC